MIQEANRPATKAHWYDRDYTIFFRRPISLVILQNITFANAAYASEILDKPKQFNGTSIVVKTDFPAETIVKDTIKNGWEPHYVVVYKRIGDELEKLANMLGLEAARY